MWIESVRLGAFGGFSDRLIRFSPGMNVLFGPNEAGKSTIHAALYAGLCGMRRAGGKPREEDAAFAARHRPWDGQSWDVGVVIHLSDGRRIEIRHDLEGRVDCRAVDLELGRDVSDEIIFEGAPDGSRWLGLDRRAFLATACVRQADLMGIARSPDVLQEHLQRAAATAGSESTAAAALDRLDRFQREAVGRDQANSTRPLRRARDRAELLERELEEARGAHAAYERLAERVDVLDQASRLERGSPVAEREAQAQRGEIAALDQRLTALASRQRLISMVAGVALALVAAGVVSTFFASFAVTLALIVVGGLLLIWSALPGPARAQREATERRAQLVDEMTAREQTRQVAISASEQSLAEARGQLRERATDLPDIAALEESADDARRELVRLRKLDEVLGITRELLQSAETHVHRTIAPALSTSVNRWLPRVTGERYQEAAVDPASLRVRVRAAAGQWRDASLLSHGTAEQVYLLLRVAAAEQLVRSGEVCPLLLDDLTVQFDAARTEAVLRTLHALSAERQVILFTQEAEVVGWALANLSEPVDRLDALDGSIVAA
ncbi:MAG: AAA family ATPase [Chloroflexota bacterium]